jgi:hypothetical protein
VAQTLQLLRRAQCLDHAFQSCIEGIIRRAVPDAKQDIPSSAAAVVAPDKLGGEQLARAANVKLSSDLLTGQAHESSVWTKRQLLSRNRSLHSLSQTSTFFHPLATSATSSPMVDAVPMVDPDRPLRSNHGVNSRFCVSSSALMLQVSVPAKKPSLFLARFNVGEAEVEFRPAPVKTAARMHEKLAEYAAGGVAWPRCAAILDPVRSLQCDDAHSCPATA